MVGKATVDRLRTFIERFMRQIASSLRHNEGNPSR